MSHTTSELRLPADPAFIVVAKRAAGGFASVAGFDVEAVDDVVIAVAQACQNAIACCNRAVGRGQAQLRLLFTLEGKRLEVSVRSVLTPEASGSRRVASSREAAASRPVAASHERPSTAGERALEGTRAEAEVATELALRVMGLFVDEYGYRLDERTGGLRVRLTKYRGT